MECICQPMLQPDLTPVIGAVAGALLLGAYLVAWGVHLLDTRRSRRHTSHRYDLRGGGHAARRAMDHTSTSFMKQVEQWLRR